MLLWCTASPPAWAGQNTLFLLGAHDISPIVLNLPADPLLISRAEKDGRPDGNLAKGVSDILATLKRETPFKAEE